jgi:hypothetical protein
MSHQRRVASPRPDIDLNRLALLNTGTASSRPCPPLVPCNAYGWPLLIHTEPCTGGSVTFLNPRKQAGQGARIPDTSEEAYAARKELGIAG